MVIADGAFDPLHVGHVWYLREAAKLGRPLVVNIAPDEAIRAKGREPFQGRSERMLTVMALGMVDRVVSEPLAKLILDRTPRYVVKGPDWKDKLPADVLQACQDVGAEIRYTDTESKRSSERL